MSDIALFVIGFGRPDLLVEQKRLLDKFLRDDFGLCVIDNTPGIMRNQMERTCKDLGIGYLHVPGIKTEHYYAMDFAAQHVMGIPEEYFGFLDHDIFPYRKTSLIDKVEKAGFFGLGQTHHQKRLDRQERPTLLPKGRRYLWPGFCFFSKSWLNGRSLNFDGIRGKTKAEDGDVGSMNHTLFSDGDWYKFPLIEHSHKSIRNIGENIQSYGYEIIGDWVHWTNASHWMEVEDPQGRDRMLMEMIRCL